MSSANCEFRLLSCLEIQLRLYLGVLFCQAAAVFINICLSVLRYAAVAQCRHLQVISWWSHVACTCLRGLATLARNCKVFYWRFFDATTFTNSFYARKPQQGGLLSHKSHQLQVAALRTILSVQMPWVAAALHIWSPNSQEVLYNS